MNRNILPRRILELTVRIISFVFALEILFSFLYFFCLTKNYNESYRKLVFYLENSIGITVFIVNLFCIVFSLFIVIKDHVFPFSPFIICLAETVVSALLVLLIQLIEVTIFQGVTIVL